MLRCIRRDGRKRKVSIWKALAAKSPYRNRNVKGTKTSAGCYKRLNNIEMRHTQTDTPSSLAVESCNDLLSGLNVKENVKHRKFNLTGCRTPPARKYLYHHVAKQCKSQQSRQVLVLWNRSNVRYIKLRVTRFRKRSDVMDVDLKAFSIRARGGIEPCTVAGNKEIEFIIILLHDIKSSSIQKRLELGLVIGSHGRRGKCFDEG